jgi:hypothetical protein
MEIAQISKVIHLVEGVDDQNAREIISELLVLSVLKDDETYTVEDIDALVNAAIAQIRLQTPAYSFTAWAEQDLTGILEDFLMYEAIELNLERGGVCISRSNHTADYVALLRSEIYDYIPER